jgi:hypothetical protein
MFFDAYVLQLLRFVTATLCAATFSNSYVLGRKRCVMLRFVAVPCKSLQLFRFRLNMYSVDKIVF